MSSFVLPSFSKNIPNKIGRYVNVSEKNTLISTHDFWRFAIADESIDAKVDGKKFFCARVVDSSVMIGFTPMETFDSKKEAYFGFNDFTGCGLRLDKGDLRYPINKSHNIIDKTISEKAAEIIVILTISNNGTKKEIRFLCDGNETATSDVSEILNGDRLFPAISSFWKNQPVTTIPIDQIETRTPEIENFIKEYLQQPKNFISIEEVKQARKDLLKQNEEMMMNFFNQLDQQQAKENEDETEHDGSRAEPPQLPPFRRDREEKEQDGNSVRGSSLTADGSKQ
jgi:hypothetical protein